jgi:thymidylate synthase
MNSLDKQYTDLLKTILEHGGGKADRTGTGTKSIFGYTIRHNMAEGFPLITTKKMPFKTIATELMWFLRGDTNIKYLVDNGCNIWNGDAYKNYLKWAGNNPLTIEEFIEKIKTDDEFAKKWGELGPVYGKQWRNWETYQQSPYDTLRYNKKHPSIDQIANLINDLKTNPDSRRLMVNAWNVGELDQMVLPPCHYGFQVYTRELSLKERVDYGSERNMWKLGQTINHMHLDENHIPTRAISLMWNQRSVDTFLGLPFNIASYGFLLEIIATAVNMVPDQLIGNLGDTHLYLDHLEQAQEQIGREMTWEEQIQWVMKNTDVEMENLYITEEVYKDTTPKRTRQPFPLPKLRINTEFWPTESGECGIGPLHQDFETLISNMQIDDFQIEGYQSHPTIKAPLSN